VGVYVGPRATGVQRYSLELEPSQVLNGGIFLKKEEINNARNAETDA